MVSVVNIVCTTSMQPLDIGLGHCWGWKRGWDWGGKLVTKRSTHARPGMHTQQFSVVLSIRSWGSGCGCGCGYFAIKIARIQRHINDLRSNMQHILQSVGLPQDRMRTFALSVNSCTEGASQRRIA